jgi:tetratricopeptide (TPR) repeat protein
MIESHPRKRMTKSCPACGFVSGPEARYCRMCGVALPHAAREYDTSDAPVSPNAATVPLASERAATSELEPHDTESPVSAPTSRVRREEFEEFRRRLEETPDAGAPSGDFATSAAPHARAAAERGGTDPLTISVRPFDEERPDSQDDKTLHAPANTTAPPPDSTATPHGPSHAASATSHAPGSSRLDAVRPGADGGPSHVAAGSSHVAAEASRVADGSPPAADGGPRSSGEAGAARRAPEGQARRMWIGMAVFGVIILLLVAVAVVVGWMAMRGGLMGSDPAPASATQPAPADAARPADAAAQSAARLAEAEQLLASGRTDEAVARLREAAALDPSNAEPHRRLARLLLDSGARRTAIEELRAIVRIDERDAPAWRELASAQSAEGLHAESAESFARLFSVSPEAARDDRLRLSHADALRLAGRRAEAVAAYERLADSPAAEVARASRRHLARLKPEEDEEANDNGERADSSPSPAPSPTAATRADDRASQTTRTPEPTPAPTTAQTPAANLSPRERYERGVRLWPTDRRAALSDFAAAAQAGNSDAHYYLGLSLAEGRDPRALTRGQLVAALNYFQRARRGRHSTDARRYEAQLLQEYDRRRQQ